MSKAILRVSYETTPLMKAEGITNGFKTLAIFTSDTVEVIKEKLAEKLIKGLSTGKSALILYDIKQMDCRLTSTSGYLNTILFDDSIIGESGITPQSNLHLSPKPLVPELALAPEPPESRHRSNSRGKSPVPEDSRSSEKQSKKLNVPTEDSKKKDKRNRTKSFKPSNHSEASQSNHNEETHILKERLCQLVSICDSLYQELILTKKWNVHLEERLAQLESAGGNTASPPLYALEAIENVTLRRQLAVLRRDTREEIVVDEDSLIKDFEQQQGLTHELQLISSTLVVEVDEVDNASTLFRGRSPSTLLISKFLQKYGRQYKENILTPAIQKIANESSLNCEVNPRQLDASQLKHLSAHCENLRHALYLFFASIMGNPVPSEFSTLFNLVTSQVATRFANSNMHLRAVGGFFFLRFVCPFLVSYPAPPEGRKTLLYVSKIMQNLANNQQFDNKEAYMMEFNPIITSSEHEMTQFLTDISKGPRTRTLSASTVVKRANFTRDDSELGLKSFSPDLMVPASPRQRLSRERKNVSMDQLELPPSPSAGHSTPAPSSLAAHSATPPLSSTGSPSALPPSSSSSSTSSSSTAAEASKSPVRDHDQNGSTPSRSWTRATGKDGKKYEISVSLAPN